MGLSPHPDPVPAELRECARCPKSYARGEFTGNGRVRLFEAFDLIEAMVRDASRSFHLVADFQ